MSEEEGAGDKFGAIEGDIAHNAQDREKRGEDAFDGKLEKLDQAGDAEAEHQGADF